MPFDKETIVPTRTPTEIGRITVHSSQASSASTGMDACQVTYEVLDQNGVAMGDRSRALMPLLAPAQLTAQGTFLTNLRAKLVAEVLGP